MKIDKPGLYTMEADAYHADPCPEPSLSSSLARTLVNRSPKHAWTDHPRLNPDYQSEERTDFDLGSAAHALFLEGADRMAIIDADSYKTGAAKEARDAARVAGKFPVLKAKYPDVLKMRDIAVRAIGECSDLSGITLADGAPEQTAIWREGDAWCRARFDWMHRDRALILDYKTTSASAEPNAWMKTMLGLGGDVQGAFYLRANAAAGGAEDAKFVFIVQEVDPPFAVSFVGLPPSFLALGAAKVAVAIAEWQSCMKTNRWPAYPNRIAWIEPPPWEMNRWAERRGDAPIGNEYDVAKLWAKLPETTP